MNDVSTNLPLRLTRRQRIRKTREFRLCYDGARTGDDHLLVFAILNDLHLSRMGVSVSRKHGNAVARNHKKRRLREAYRLIQHRLPVGLDLVLVPRQRSDSTVRDYQKSLLKLAQKLSRRIRKAQESEESTS